MITIYNKKGKIPNLWYAKCQTLRIVEMGKSPYLCTQKT